LLRRITLVLFFFMCLSIVNAVAPEKAILFVVSITKDSNATLENYFATKDFITPSEAGDYSFELLDGNKNLLYKINANVVFHSVGMPYGWSLEQSKDLIKETSTYEVLYIVFPFFKGASYFRIKKYGKTILEKKISLCNYNGECEEHENSLSCSDCSASDGFCVPDADDICDPDCMPGIDPDCKQQSGSKTETRGASATNYVLFGLLLVIVLILAYNIKKRFKR